MAENRDLKFTLKIDLDDAKYKKLIDDYVEKRLKEKVALEDAQLKQAFDSMCGEGYWESCLGERIREENKRIRGAQVNTVICDDVEEPIKIDKIEGGLAYSNGKVVGFVNKNNDVFTNGHLFIHNGQWMKHGDFSHLRGISHNVPIHDNSLSLDAYYKVLTSLKKENHKNLYSNLIVWDSLPEKQESFSTMSHEELQQALKRIEEAEKLKPVLAELAKVSAEREAKQKAELAAKKEREAKEKAEQELAEKRKREEAQAEAAELAKQKEIELEAQRLAALHVQPIKISIGDVAEPINLGISKPYYEMGVEMGNEAQNIVSLTKGQKMKKYAKYGAAAALVLGALSFTRLGNYASTGFGIVTNGISSVMPQSFHIQRAKGMVEDIDGEIKDGIQTIIKEEMKLSRQQQQLSKLGEQMNADKSAIQGLVARLKGTETLVSLNNEQKVDRSAASILLNTAFQRYKLEEQTLANVAKSVADRTAWIEQGRSKIELMKAKKAQMVTQIENIETRSNISETTDLPTLDESNLVEAEELINELTAHLDTRQKITEYLGATPVVAEPSNVVEEVSAYFGETATAAN